MKAAFNLLGGVAMLIAAIGPVPVRAAYVTYLGTDFGAGPGDPHPNSAATAATFDAAAALLGPVDEITFKGMPPGQPSADGVPLAVSNGVKITLEGADHNTLAPGYNFGLTSSPATASVGYSTTPGDANFFEFAPRLGGGTASLRLTLATPTPFFGFYLTGLGTANGDLHVVFNDSLARDIAVGGSTQGGAQFLGITDAGARISTITLELRNVVGLSRDVFGIDGIRLLAQPVPEPPAALLALLGGPALLGYLRHRRGLRSKGGPVPA